MEESRTYYQILGLERSATPDQIKAAHARMQRLFHPDLHPDASEKERSEYNRRSTIINLARDTLIDSASRSAYDKDLDEEVSVATDSYASQSQTYSRGYSSKPSYEHPNDAYGGDYEDNGHSHEHDEYGAFNRGEVQKLYASSKQFVIEKHECTKQKLKERLRIHYGVASRDLDKFATRFLDQMCLEGILYKTTGAKTRYHFLEAEEDDDNVADYEEYGDAPVQDEPVKRSKPLQERSGTLLGVVLWLLAGGWAWHHFASHPATPPQGMQNAGSSLRSGQTVEPLVAQRQRSPDVRDAQTSVIQGAVADQASPPALAPSSSPLQDSAGDLRSRSSADTPLPNISDQRETPSSDPPASDWHIAHETAPVYPIAALRSGESGTTVVEVKVDAAGNIIDARVHASSGYRDLDISALRAVRTFGFAPSDDKGFVHGGTVLVPVDFRQQ